MCGQGCQTMFKIECNMAVRCFAPVINEGSVPTFMILHSLLWGVSSGPGICDGSEVLRPCCSWRLCAYIYDFAFLALRRFVRARNMCGQGCQTMFKIECNMAVRCFAPVINEGSVPTLPTFMILHSLLWGVSSGRGICAVKVVKLCSR